MDRRRSLARLARLAALLPLVPACTTSPRSPADARDPPAKVELRSEAPLGRELIANLDASTDPCTDFYQFACGGWLAQNPLPADKPVWGRAFGELGERNRLILREILEQDQGRSGRLYAACMDATARSEAGVAPLAPYLRAIDALDTSDLTALFALIGDFDAGIGSGALFSFGLSIDFEQPELHISNLGQGGIGLPDRSYYLDARKREQWLPLYRQHIARMLALLGDSDERAQAAAARIVAFEQRLAELHEPPEALRDPQAVYHRWDRKGLEARSPLPWATYFTHVGAEKLELINVSTPRFIEGLPAAIASADAQTLRDYLRFGLISGNANVLSESVAEASFAFASAMTGQQSLQAPWERCVAASTGALGDLVSQAFVARSFAGDSREIAAEMIAGIEAAFAANLPALAWMDDSTREAAVGKVAKVVNKVGYPSKWRDYAGLEVSGRYFDDVLAVRRWTTADALARIGRAVDDELWVWPASTVNAGYNPLQNTMLFPAGILQPPFFSREFPQAMNYGAMGMVMGHELTHGFDDSGRKFDGDGVMREWWSAPVVARYEQRTACLVDSYGAIEVQPGVRINGQLTLGENIADFGGLKLAHAAYAAWVDEHGPEPALVEGLSNAQLFFVAYAQSWCSVASPQFEALLATVDTHSPPRQRVNVPLAHSPEFWAAYGCHEGEAMRTAAEQVCSVW